MTNPSRSLLAAGALALTLGWSTTAASAAVTVLQDTTVRIPMTSDAWVPDGAVVSFERHLGRDAMRVEGGEVVAEGIRLVDGVIGFDVAIDPERSFAGMNFRRLGAAEHESFYLRSHQSGNPDANQYTPVFHGTPGWQIYYGPQYATPTQYRYGEWMRVRLIVSGDEAEVHLDGEPILHIADLKRDAMAGGVSLWTNVAPAWFAEVTVSTSPAPFEMEGVPQPELAPGTVRSWSVSDPFRWEDVTTADTLSVGFIQSRVWQTLEVETNGIANLARVADNRLGNTVLARVTVPSEHAPTFRFGFTDAARVYVDRQLAFEGNDGYGSRDYRFLGTVGLYDAVFPRSDASTTDLIIAVREGLGGWAVAGALPQSVPVQTQVETVRGARAERIHAELSELSRSGFGGAVVASDGGEIILEAGYGFADRELGVPFTSRTTAQIGSLTKQFTAMAIIDLALDGRIRFAAPVGDYLPEATEPARSVTIHQLLTHTSGMSEYCGPDLARLTRLELQRRCMARPLRFEPGTEYAYSNPGYSVLAAVVEVVTGREFVEYLRTEIFEPNGLLDTDFPPKPDAVLAHGYLEGVDQGVASDRLLELDGDYWAVKGNGEIQMTTADMFGWYEALAGRRALGGAHIEAATEPRERDANDNWVGYGWGVGMSDGMVTRISHTGADGVFFAYFWWNPQNDRFFYLVGNNGEERVIEVVRLVLRHMSR